MLPRKLKKSQTRTNKNTEEKATYSKFPASSRDDSDDAGCDDTDDKCCHDTHHNVHCCNNEDG